MFKYIFLDTWVLSDYTKNHKWLLLSEFIHKNNYTILFDGIGATELYNPGWQQTNDGDRMYRAAKFLSQHPCHIIRPENVFRAEIQHYPSPLVELPVERSMDDFPLENKFPALLSVLSGDASLVEYGIDVKQWDIDYKSVKDKWEDDVTSIIESACKSGALLRNKQGKFIALEQSKENFLEMLDRRHLGSLTEKELQDLGTKIIELAIGSMKILSAIRFSSLCFWYAYIETDKNFPMKRKGSDIGDFTQMSLIPYCSIFTVDKTMSRLLKQVMKEAKCHTKVYNINEFDAVLKNWTYPN